MYDNKKRLLILLTFAVTTNNATVQCNTATYPKTWESNNRYVMSTKLFEWCQRDNTCSHLYHQNPWNNFTVFDFLTRGIVGSFGSLSAPLNDLICGGNYTEEVVMENVWMMLLKANANIRPVVCDWNHDIVVDFDQLNAQCVCQSNQMCSSSTSNTKSVVALLIVASVLVFCLCILLIVRIIQDTQLLKRTGKGNILSILNKAL